jgi:hypothetical protein
MLEVSDVLNSITRKRAEREVMARDPFLSAAGAILAASGRATIRAGRQHGVNLHPMDYWLRRLQRANKKLRRHSRAPDRLR